MVFLVPFDGSPRARAALDRAVRYGATLDSEAVAVSYVPTGADFAERRRWIDPSENFAADTAADHLQRKIEEATDESELRYEDESAHAPAGGLSREVRQTALDVEADVVFVGTADDGRVVVPIDGNGNEFDVFVVRATP